MEARWQWASMGTEGRGGEVRAVANQASRSTKQCNNQQIKISRGRQQNPLFVKHIIIFPSEYRMLYNYRWQEDNPSAFDPFKHLISLQNHFERDGLQYKDVNIKKVVVVQRKEQKEKLIRELEEVLSRVNDQLETEYHQDQTLRELYSIRRKAIKENFQDIHKLIQSAIGKRIYNVEAEKLRLRRKQVVYSWDIHYKTDRRCMIEVYPYAQLADSKFLEKTFLFTPYANGYAFNYASCKYSAIYPKTFKEIRAQHTIKTINEIYLNPKDLNEPLLDRILERLLQVGNYLTVVVLLYIIFQIAVFYLLPAGIISKNVESDLMLAVLSGPMLLIALTGLSIAGRQYSKKKESKTNFEKTVELVENYLARINTKNREEAKSNPEKIQFRWEASRALFYISVKIDKTIEANQSWIQLRR